MNPFKSKGFDALIPAGHIITGSLQLASGSTTQLDGEVVGESISADNKVGDNGKNAAKTTLVVNGKVQALKLIEVANVTISGEVNCDQLVVSRTLAIRKGAKVTAKTISYNNIVIEDGAILNATLIHMSVLTQEPGTNLE